MEFIQSFDGEQLGYEILALPKNPTGAMVFIHGLGGDLRFLTPTLEELIKVKPNFTIYGLCLRGHNLSSKKFPKNFATIEQVHVLDLQAFLQNRKIEKPILIGHSFGGIVIQTYLNLQLTPKIEKFFLICSTPHVKGLSFLRRLAYQALTFLPQPRSSSTNPNPDFYRQFITSHDLSPKRIWYDTKVMGGPLYYCLHFLAIWGWRNPDLQSLNQDFGYYLYGKRDIIISQADQEQSLKSLPKLKSHLLDSGHLAPLSHGSAVAEIMAKNL